MLFQKLSGESYVILTLRHLNPHTPPACIYENNNEADCAQINVDQFSHQWHALCCRGGEGGGGGGGGNYCTP
jgi:hypothetical protein